MPTPVGPAPRDPDDPDLWEAWYEADGDDATPRFGWPVRLIAIVLAVALVLLLIVAG